MARDGSGAPALSRGLMTLAREAWAAASLRFGHDQVSLPVLLLTLCSETDLRAELRQTAPALLDINLSQLEALARKKAATAAPAPRPAGEDFLAQYTTDLTADARAGRLDRVIGRDGELRQMVDILLRRRQNNPILVGEAGVGKTAIVEAFALMIADGDAPARLADVSLHVLDMNMLQAGAGVKGEFERRLKGVIDQVKAAPRPIILFVDEAHSLVGAGGAAGQGDAANILKPALARGELRTIAATTWAEYKKYFEKDPALTRRFQPVKVDEPDIETAIRMMRMIAPRFADHHGVPIRESALRAAVELSARYLPERQLPDKAVSLIDTAASAVALSRETTPEALAAPLREAEALRAEIAAHEGEPAPDDARLADLRGALARAEAAANAARERLDQQRALLDAADSAPPEDLAEAAGEAPLVHRVVDGAAVAAVVARWTGVPVGRLLRDQIDAAAGLAARLKTRVLGQDRALDGLACGMRVARASTAPSWPSLPAPRAKRFTPTNMAASGCGSRGTATPHAMAATAAGSALPRTGPAPAGAGRSSPASGWRFWSPILMAIPTARW